MNDLLHTMMVFSKELRLMLVRKTGSDLVRVCHDDRREWQGPPLISNLELCGIDLDDLPRMLYGTDKLSDTDRQHIWHESISALLAKGKPHRVVKTFYPRIHSALCISPVESLCRLAYILSWGGGKFEVSTVAIELEINGLRNGLNQRVLFDAGEPKRLPRGAAVKPSECLATPTGRSRKAGTKVTAVYRCLVTHFPELAHHLDVVFATAVHAGLEAQARLTEMFDLDHTDPVAVASVWSEARRVVSRTPTNPCRELWQLLRERMRVEEFTELFGNPHRATSGGYSPALRRKHTLIIDSFENKTINAEVKYRLGDHLQAANSLLKLQQIMGQT